MDINIPEMEEKWKKFWEDHDIYSFSYEGGKRSDYFAIDTPPPTISGKMHMGHAFSYPHQDFIARYKRMRGYKVFYPWGFDDNGLPTERYTEKLLKVKAEKMPLSEFIKACEESSLESQKDLLRNWRNIGMSASFKDYYTTSSTESKKISQEMFLDLVGKNRVYREEAPVVRCPNCHTAISQIEMKDASFSTSFVYVNFRLENGEKITIATTRPELIGSCVGLFVNPDDERFSSIIGKEVTVPVYGHKVKVFTDPSIDREKGTGAEMVCTFGDQNDLELWRKYNLDLRVLIDRFGNLGEDAGDLKGLSVQEARKKMIQTLQDSGYVEKIEKIKHSVNTHERCGTPVEIGISKQWFIRYLDLRGEFLKNGSEVNWIPEHMRTRFDNWVNGLKWDWCISRQRYYGVPFPAWYCRNCGETLFADKGQIPVDPRTSGPGKKCEKCGSSDFEPETDIMDTWATSSLSPRLSLKKLGLLEQLYPMDIRFQGHDIISFWAFTTIARSKIHDDVVPWENIMISGNVYDPYGVKMSKSKGNVVEPSTVVDEYGADALRFWSSTTIPGEDIKTKEQDFVRGRRTVIKIHNAAKLIEMLSEGRSVREISGSPELDINRWIISKLNNTVENATREMDNFTVSKARSEVDNFFWNTFCDNYLEIIKSRINYLSETGSGENEISEMLSTATYTIIQVLKMYAPVMPFITEEVYNRLPYPGKGKSIHLERWPEKGPEFSFLKEEKELDYIMQAVSGIRTLKSSLKLSMSTRLEKVILSGDSKILARHSDIIKNLMRIEDLEIKESGEITAEVPR